MEKLLKILAEQEKYFKPNDSLSRIVDKIVQQMECELEENELGNVQAARGNVNGEDMGWRKSKV